MTKGTSSKSNAIRYRELAWIYAITGMSAFGGWPTTYTLLEKELVLKRQLITQAQLKTAAASGQALPGPAQVIIAAQIAYYLKGVRGAFMVTSIYLFPSILITLLFSYFYFTQMQQADISSYTLGLQAAVAGIIFGNAYKIGKSHAIKRWLWVVALLATLICLLTPLPTVYIILGFGCVGLVAGTIKERRDA